MVLSINGNSLAIKLAASFWARFKGLMLRPRLPRGRGLLIAPCNSIHMCFMRFSIDAVFIDKNYRVLKIKRRLYPWLGFAVCCGAWGVIELQAGEIDRLSIRVDDVFITK